MSKKGNKYKIGALTIIALIILILGLLSLGIMKYFQPELLFMTATDTTVQGLKIGSNVKLKGVPIGSVKNIKIGFGGTVIYIIMKLDLDSLIHQSEDTNIKGTKEDFESTLKKCIEKGMRCQLQLEGITGDMYVNLSYYSDTSGYPAYNVQIPKGYPIYVPSIPTPNINNILENIQLIVDKLNTINFQKTSENFDALLISLNNITTQVNQIFNKGKIAEIEGNINYSLNRFNQTMASLNTLIKSIQTQPDSIVWGKTGNKVVPSLNQKE